MTLLVRKGEDIVRQNIGSHLRYGVDFIVAIGDTSVDGTGGILLEYQDQGRLCFIDEPGKKNSRQRKIIEW